MNGHSPSTGPYRKPAAENPAVTARGPFIVIASLSRSDYHIRASEVRKFRPYEDDVNGESVYVWQNGKSSDWVRYAANGDDFYNAYIKALRWEAELYHPPRTSGVGGPR